MTKISSSLFALKKLCDQKLFKQISLPRLIDKSPSVCAPEELSGVTMT